ncbi:hypothetical protein VPHK469_0077 [Vibrio phage K469]
MEKIMRIPNYKVESFLKRIGEINRKSIKLGLGEVECTEIGTSIIEWKEFDYEFMGYRKMATTAVDFSVTGPNLDNPVSYGGYTFVGKIDHTHSKYMWKSFDESPMPEHVKVECELGHSYCEHCNTKRQRNNTFVIRNEETGGLVWVGSSCLRDYIGLTSPDGLLGYYRSVEALNDCQDRDDDYIGLSKPTRLMIDLYRFLPLVAANARLYGFLTKSSAIDNGGYATSSTTFNDYWAISPPEDRPKVTEADCLVADGALEMWLAKDDDSDFNHNMRVLCEDMWCSHREVGLASWIIGSYLFEKDKAEKEERAESEYWGKVGDKVNGLGIELTITYFIEFTTDFGYQTQYNRFYVMTTDDGVVFTMNSSKDMETGSRILLTSGSIKEHELYKGVKQTVLARPRFKLLTSDEA